MALCIVFAAICIVGSIVQEYRIQRRRWRVLMQMMERENEYNILPPTASGD